MCDTFGSVIVVDGVRLSIDDLPDSPEEEDAAISTASLVTKPTRLYALPEKVLTDLNRPTCLSRTLSDTEQSSRDRVSQDRYCKTYDRMLARKAIELQERAKVSCHSTNPNNEDDDDEEEDVPFDDISSPSPSSSSTPPSSSLSYGKHKRSFVDYPEIDEFHSDSLSSSSSSSSSQGKRQRVSSTEYGFEYDGTPTARDALWVDERPTTSESDTSVKWIPVLDPWQKDFESLIQPGESHEPTLCFGCDWQESNGHNAVYVDKWNQLVRAFLDGIMNTGRISSLGKQLYEIFTKTVVATMIDDCILDHIDKEVWTPYGIMYHFLYHNPDPFIRMYVLTMRVRLSTETIISNELYEEHPVSGRRVVVQSAQQKLDKAIETELKLLKSNPISMTFANKNRKLSETGYPMLNSRVPLISQSSIGHSYHRWS